MSFSIWVALRTLSAVNRSVGSHGGGATFHGRDPPDGCTAESREALPPRALAGTTHQPDNSNVHFDLPFRQTGDMSIRKVYYITLGFGTVKALAERSERAAEGLADQGFRRVTQASAGS